MFEPIGMAVAGLAIIALGITAWMKYGRARDPTLEEVVDARIREVRAASASIQTTARMIRVHAKELSTQANVAVVEINRLCDDLSRDKRDMTHVVMEIPAIMQLDVTLKGLLGLVQSRTGGSKFEESMRRCSEALESAIAAIKMKREELNLDNHIAIQGGANAAAKMFGDGKRLEDVLPPATKKSGQEAPMDGQPPTQRRTSTY